MDYLGPEDSPIQLVPASFSKRLANYIIDVVIFSFLLAFALGVVGSVYAPLRQQILEKQPFNYSQQFGMLFLYGLFLSCSEAIFRGKSIGKFITRTRAVTADGKPISANLAFVRGLLRLIPFEPFTAISSMPFPLHDRWSRTIVVDENASVLPPREQ